MNEFLLSIASFVIVLVPMILLHEIGHFIAAKLVGITILEFGLGFPPRITKLFERGGTEYTLNWLPLGGFVRPLGEDFVRPIGNEGMASDRDIAIRRGVDHPKSVNQAGPWARIFFMSAGAGMNFITAMIVFVIMALIGLPVVSGATLSVRSVQTGSAAAQAGLQVGDVISQVDGRDIRSTTAFMDYLTINEGQEATLTVERGGETFDVSLFIEGTSAAAVTENVLVLGVEAESPAHQAGLEPGDIILEANGTPIEAVQALVDFTDTHMGENISLLVEREGEQLTVELVPRVDPPAGQGPMGIMIGPAYATSALGVTLAEYDQIINYTPQPLGEAINYSLERTAGTLDLFARAPIMLIRGEITADEARPVSIIGISQIGGARLEESVEAQTLLPILDFAAIISMALGLTNLLPIPGLDGGRILFVLIELLRGKAMDPEREGMVHLIGLFLLLGVLSIIILNDLINPLPLP